jgi:hypothetical protein
LYSTKIIEFSAVVPFENVDKKPINKTPLFSIDLCYFKSFAKI